jgi:peptidoglycan L-alanyl-D-glutamate endopeptidase CwlK
MRKWSARSLKNLHGIHPDLRRVMDKALQDSPLDFIVIEGLRTRERQKELVASGASRRLESRHLTGHAVDILPIGLNGKAAFDWPLYDRVAPAIKSAAEDLGVKIIWGGDWKTFRDGPHFELDEKVYPAGEWETSEQPPVERTSAAQSKTVQASVVAAGSALGSAATAIAGLDSVAQYIIIGFAGIGLLMALWIMRERLRKWAEGDR